MLHVCIHIYIQGTNCLWFCLCARDNKDKGPEEGAKLPFLTAFAFCAGRSKGKGPGEKLPLLAVQCLEALLTLGRTAEGVAEVLQDVPLAEDHALVASDAGVHIQCCLCHIG